MAVVVEALREEHQNIVRLLAALEHQVELFAGAGDVDYDVVVGITDYFLDYPDRCHHPKENVILGRLRAAYPDAAVAAGDLEGEHRALHERAARFRETIAELLGETDIARAEVVEAARGFIEAQRRHLRMEEESFLPLADQVLTPADWRAIEHELSARRDPLFGAAVEARFQTLSAKLLAWEAEDEGG